jgi:putative N6-adenine-specific DNA methylase
MQLDNRAITAGFATVAPGLEGALVDELTDLGLEPVLGVGMVSFGADVALIRRVCRWSRVASRAGAILGQFRASNLEQLGNAVRRLPWGAVARPHQKVDVHLAAQRSRLMREAVPHKVEHAIEDALRGPRISAGRSPRDPVGVLVHVEEDSVEIQVDAAGDPLHKRGWRLETAKAPLRENLAAAVLRLAGWNPGEALVDPMCGSGTFGIEAAQIAMGIAPGGRRAFAFERWPAHDARAWAAEQVEAPVVLDREAAILAADRDGGAIRAAQGNAKRARVERRIRIEERAFADLAPPGPSGLVVVNPPYGERIERGAGPEAIRAFGGIFRERWAGWRLAILLPDPRWRKALGVETKEVATFSNGGLKVRLCVSD